MEPMTDEWEDRLEERVLAPTRASGRLWAIWVASLALIIIWGFVAYVYQWREGLYVTDMRDRISWGIYIAAFIFFTGISMAGTVISAILRVSNASWRTPIVRIAEAITAVGLVCGGLFIIVDMGHPERLYHFWINGNWQSPLMWDMMAITTYLTASVMYLYVPMIPDLAMFRDRLGDKVSWLQSWLYRTMAIGWNNNESQRKSLHRTVGILMVVIIPVAAVVHTVVSWIFAMTTRASWDSTIFGLFFVAGAIFSGVATLIIVLAVLRRVYHLEEYITLTHFKYLAYIMASMALVMIYSNVTEYLVPGYKMSEHEEFAFRQLFVEEFAKLYWFYVLGGLILPILIVSYKKTRTVGAFVVAAVFVNIGMFIERYLIVVAGMRIPLLSYEPSNYSPTWVEWSVVASGIAGFMMLLTLFAKFFPILAVWEMKEERAEETPSEPVVDPVDEPEPELEVAR